MAIRRHMTGTMLALSLAAPGWARDKANDLGVLTIVPRSVGDVGRQTRAIGQKLRLRIDTVTLSPTSTNIVTERVQQRLAGQMIEYYPIEGKGFHLSAGTHLYAPRSPGNEKNANDLLYPAQLRGGRSMPSVGLRSTPAATMGYTGKLDRTTAIGIEMGAMKGRSYATEREVTGRGRDDTLNPMVNLTLGHKF